VKGCVCPPEGYYLVESDYSSLEVHVAACYNKDPTLISYLENDYDMHRAVSKQCYLYEDDFIEKNPKLAKTLRQAAKGDAVFSWFYGNYYKDVTLRLWKTATNSNMIEHLASKGIKRLGLEFDHKEGEWVEIPGPDAFVTHIKNVEDDFWNKRYKVYNQWRKSWFANYAARGFFHTLTGFAWYGVEKRNFVINCPIQGSAFHCLLRSIIDIQAEIKRTAMDAAIACEIHDSIVAIVHKNHLHDYVAMSNHIMTTRLREQWPWIILRLKTEVEVSPVSWADKTAYTGNES
jgi:DNA polymerase I-like protein with 3'-5' exonuclease and polymerase domains